MANDLLDKNPDWLKSLYYMGEAKKRTAKVLRMFCPSQFHAMPRNAHAVRDDTA
jgi:hypothetical protein